MELNVINEKIGVLRTAEGQVKGLVGELAVAVLERIRVHDEVDSANNFLAALTPANKKKAEQFFKVFSGHKFEKGLLGKRHKKTLENGKSVDKYLECKDKFDAFKASDDTFWTWSAKQSKAEEAAITLDKVVSAAKKARKSIKEGIEKGVVDKVQAFEILTGGVFSFEDMQMVLAAMAKAEDAVTQAAKQSLGQV